MEETPVDKFENPASINRGVTLNDLKEELYSLNMRLLLAIQNHDGEAQKNLEAQIAALQDQIESINLRGWRGQ